MLKITISGDRRQGKTTAALLLKEALEGLGVTVTLKDQLFTRRPKKEQHERLMNAKAALLCLAEIHDVEITTADTDRDLANRLDHEFGTQKETP